MQKLVRKFWATLTKRERSQVLLLTGAVTVMAGLEVVSVSATIPFLTAAADPGAVEDDTVLSFLYARLGFEDKGRFLIALGLMVFGLMLVSNAWMALTTWMQARLVWLWNHSLSTRLLRRYLYQPYTYFLSRNTADLTKNVLSEVEQLAAQLMVPAVEGLGRGVVALGIIASLVIMQPIMALLITVIVGGSYALVFGLTRRQLSRVGAERLAANQERFKIATEALSGIKEVKLLGLEESFLERFTKPSVLFSRHRATSEVIARVPRYGVEPIAFGTAVLMVVYLVARQGDLAGIVPLLGFYAFAGYRLMPAVQQAFRGLTQIRFYAPALENLLNELEATDKAKVVPVRSVSAIRSGSNEFRIQRAIELRNVTFWYPGANRPAIRDLSLTIPANSTIGLVGPTGSGKTTIADLILGLLRPQVGEILVDGTVLTDDNLPSWQATIGYVPQDIFLIDASVAENIAFGVTRDQIDMEAVRWAAKIAMIDTFINEELPNAYDTIVGERGVRLSGGQRQRIGVARALYRNPSVIVFDEATSALDNRTEESLMEAIRSLRGGCTIVLIAHRLTTLRDSDAIYMLDHGHLVASGSFEQLVRGEGRFGQLTRTK